MDSDRLETPLVETLRATRQARHKPQHLSRFSGGVAEVGEYFIKQRLARAEQFIRQQHPKTALALLQATGAPPAGWPRRWHSRWFLLVGWALIQHQQPAMASDVLQHGLELFHALQLQPKTTELPLPELGEWLRYFLGVSYWQCNQPSKALGCYRCGLAAIIAGTIHDAELIMLLYQGLGQTYLSIGADAEALAYLTLAREHGQDVNNPYAEGMTELSLGLAYTQQRNLFQARRALTQALRLFERLEIPLLVLRVMVRLGQVLLELQHEEEAESMLRQALGGAERSGDPQTRGEALEGLARLHLARGKSEQAIYLIKHGLAISSKSWGKQIAGQLYLTLAHAYGAQHDLGAAEEALLAAIGLLHSTPSLRLIAHAHECYGQFLADQGRFQEAYEQLEVTLRKNDL
jgi:tetratricopeptide (TPR) repeat protein